MPAKTPPVVTTTRRTALANLTDTTAKMFKDHIKNFGPGILKLVLHEIQVDDNIDAGQATFNRQSRKSWRIVSRLTMRYRNRQQRSGQYVNSRAARQELFEAVDEILEVFEDDDTLNINDFI